MLACPYDRVANLAAYRVDPRPAAQAFPKLARTESLRRCGHAGHPPANSVVAPRNRHGQGPRSVSTMNRPDLGRTKIQGYPTMYLQLRRAMPRAFQSSVTAIALSCTAVLGAA